MGFKDGLKKQKDGTYILSHKSKEAKEGDCIECGQNPKSRMLMFKYNTEDFKLVRESLKERDIILNIANNIVEPIPFIIPYNSTYRSFWLIKIGLKLYDFLDYKY